MSRLPYLIFGSVFLFGLLFSLGSAFPAIASIGVYGLVIATVIVLVHLTLPPASK